MYAEYVDWLIDVNLRQQGLASDEVFRSTPFISTFAFGLLEELYEYLEAEGEAKVKEAGDCLAYYCLLAVSLGFSRSYVIGQLQTAERQTSFSAAPMLLAGECKRLFRGDGSLTSVETEAFRLLLFVVNDCGCFLEAVAETNKQKLTDRLDRTGTFKGKGDNR